MENLEEKIAFLENELKKEKEKNIAQRKYLCEHLIMWMDEGIPAPLNEAQSIQSWLSYLSSHTKEETMDTMRKRMILLGKTASDIYEKGREAEKEVGIYKNRPDLDPQSKV